MTGPGEEGIFLDLRKTGGAEEIARRYPPPSFFTAFIDGEKASAKDGLMDELARAFSFPAYFGRNWDALLDCLRSLHDYSPAGGYVLAVRNSKAFLSLSAAEKEEFADIAAEADSFLKEKHGAFFLIALL